MALFQSQRLANRHVEPLLQPMDQTAVWLFRNDNNPAYGTDNKFKGRRVQAHFQEMGPTHGHLFKRRRV